MGVTKWVHIWNGSDGANSVATASIDLGAEKYENAFIQFGVSHPAAGPSLGTATYAALKAEFQAFDGGPWSTMFAGWFSAGGSGLMLCTPSIIENAGGLIAPVKNHPLILPLIFVNALKTTPGATLVSGTPVVPTMGNQNILDFARKMRFRWISDGAIDTAPSIWVGLVKARHMV